MYVDIPKRNISTNIISNYYESLYCELQRQSWVGGWPLLFSPCREQLSSKSGQLPKQLMIHSSAFSLLPPLLSSRTSFFPTYTYVRFYYAERRREGRERERETRIHEFCCCVSCHCPSAFFSNFFFDGDNANARGVPTFSPCIECRGNMWWDSRLFFRFKLMCLVLCGVMGGGAALCLMHWLCRQRNFRGLATWGSLSPPLSPLFFAACILLPLPRALHAPSETTATRD